MSVDDRRRSSHRVATVVPSISRERFRTCVFIGFESTRRSKQGSWIPLFSTLQLQKVRPDKIREFFFTGDDRLCTPTRGCQVQSRGTTTVRLLPGRGIAEAREAKGPTPTTPWTYPNYPKDLPKLPLKVQREKEKVNRATFLPCSLTGSPTDPLSTECASAPETTPSYRAQSPDSWAPGRRSRT